MYSSLDDVAFLASSPNRVEVLDFIQSAPQTRDDLKTTTEISRVTLSRILNELEERGWIERSNHKYEPTPRGAFFAAEFTQLLKNMETAEELDDALWWLPTERLGFDLECLRDAQVRVQSRSDHTAAIRAVAEHVLQADQVRGMASGVSREVIEAFRDLTVERDGSLELILEPMAIDIVRTDAGLRQQFQQVLESGGATVYRYDGDDPIVMMLFTDEAVVLCGHDENGPPPGSVETMNATVHAWAEGYFASIRTDAEQVGGETFTP